MKAHPSAIVHPEATIADDVEIGPFAVIDAGVRVASGSRIASHAWLTSDLRIDHDVEIGHGAVLGAAPQDLSFDPQTRSGLVIGPRTTIREYATLHRATSDGGATRVGADCLIMTQAHVAHDVVVGDRVVICNNALIPGHVVVGDRVFISGNVAVHQFCRLGTGAMIGGQGAVGRDVPPWTTITGRSRISAINIVGMRRAGFDAETRLEIKALYRAIFKERGDLEHARSVLAAASDRPAVRTIRDFYAGPSKRGFCWPAARGEDATESGD